MAENQPKTKRELFGERMKAKYPDREFADDEAMYGQINDDYDEYENSLNTYKEREKKLTDLFSHNKRSAQFLTDMANGVDPFLSMIESMGIEGISDVINDPEKKEAYAEANQKYVERIAQEESLKSEYEKNFGESMSLLERMQQERGLGDETIDEAMDLVMKIANEAIVGKFTEETIDMALKAVNHDADMENARTEGTVAGRNAKIEERLRKPESGDGVPVMGGANNVPRTSSRPRSMFDLANEAK